MGSPIANNTGDGYVSIEYGSINGINNFTFNPKTIQVYPNPSSGQFNVIVNVKLSMVNEMQVYNIMGQEISQFTINHSQFAIDLSTQSNGVYLYRVVVNDGSLMSEGKLVIQK